MKFQIKEATSADFLDVMMIEKSAFKSDVEADLVANLLRDKSAKPIVSLLAFHNDEAVGHILFTRAYINSKQPQSLVHILAPLAVIPAFQNRGVGGQLINNGLKLLQKLGTELVFVLGYSDYYSKYGFIPDAESLGYQAAFPVPKKNADAWMVQSLIPDKLELKKGKIICADEMNKIEYWTE